MSTSAEASLIWQEVSFSAATSPPTVAAATQVTRLIPGTDGPSSSTSIASQYLKITATHTVNAGTATIRVLFVDDDRDATPAGAGIFHQLEFTVTATTVRQDHGGAAGDYVCTVVGVQPPLNNIADISGHGFTNPKIYIACTALSGGTVTVRVMPGRAI